MPEYRLHCFPESGNCYKAALMLNLCGADWEPVFVDYFAGQTRQDGWRGEINAFGEAPVLEHDGEKSTQSGVILHELSERFGKFGASDAKQAREILRWILFDNHKFTSYFATHRFLNCLAPAEPDAAVMDFLRTRAQAALGIADKHLAGSKFVAGSEPTIADISMAGYMFYPSEETSFDLAADYPNIAAWTERLKDLEGWKGPYELMPGKRVPHRAA